MRIYRLLLPAFILAIAAGSLRADPPPVTLFWPDAYVLLGEGKDVPGEYIDEQYEGRTFKRDQIGELARVMFIAHANDAGIPTNEITKAMFEGRFNPAFEELTLIYESFGKPDPAYLNDYFPHHVDRLLEDGTISHRFEMPPDLAIHGIIRGYKTDRFNETFGSPSEMGTVNTIANGRERRMTLDDLSLRYYMRITSGDRFRRNIGIPEDGNMSFAEAEDRIREAFSNTPGEIHNYLNNLHMQVRGVPLGSDEEPDYNYFGHLSAYTYFDRGSAQTNSPTNLREDYAQLRQRFGRNR